VRGLLSLLCCILTVSRGPARAETVIVTAVQPDTHTDAALNGAPDSPGQAFAFAEIKTYIQALVVRHIPPQRSLRVQLLNIELAGRIESWRRDGYDVRVVRNVYPPRITLRYQLTEGTRTIAVGTETVSDVNYLANPKARLTSDPLRYEKAMLSDWFEARFVAR
jgi:hypothetical protein